MRNKVINLAVRILNKCLATGGIKVFSAEDVQVPTKYGTIKFYCTNTLTRWRAQSFFEKEPETLAWIDSFEQGDVLWDIGANVGLYSLYAAKKGATVLAFEPAIMNHHILVKNIELNALSESLMSYSIAFNDTSKLDFFYMSETIEGSALHNFGANENWQGGTIHNPFKQAMVGYSIDDFMKDFNPDFPQHIKIDVDGIEDKIIQGGKETFADPRLKSVMVEIDKEDEIELIKDRFSSAGLIFIERKHAAMFDEGEYAKVYNYLFKRIS